VIVGIALLPYLCTRKQNSNNNTTNKEMKMMKKIGSIAMMVMMLMATPLLTSCGSDDDEEVVDVVSAATAVAKEYNGYTEAKSTYFSGMTSDAQTVNIVAVSADKVNISYTSDTWGTFTINNATVTKTDNGYSISGEGVTAMAHAGQEAKEYACSFNGTVEADGTPEFVFSVPSVMGGLTITLYPGNAPSTED
jgi:hypothetical protein